MRDNESKSSFATFCISGPKIVIDLVEASRGTYLAMRGSSRSGILGRSRSFEVSSAAETYRLASGKNPVLIILQLKEKHLDRLETNMALSLNTACAFDTSK